MDSFKAGLVLLDESEAQIIRARMAEEAIRHLFQGSAEQQVICLECREVGDFVTLLKHMSMM
jgi:3-deoxy-D-manno-octulosonate 8-phosphate phosphatase KdsC-like HAD superfamily phosphatase